MTEPRKFRKKPVVIEAMQFDGENGAAFEAWSEGAARITPDDAGWNAAGPNLHRMSVRTREGGVFAFAGDWIIRGVAGEYYPCGDEIFRATYEDAP